MTSMSAADPRTWLDKVVSACLSLLVGAAAVFIAVQLVEAVWTALLVILGVGVFLAVAGMVLRSRNRGW
jgi:hypothetical protein